MDEKKTIKLHRSKTDRMFAGICGGLGDYLDIDSTIIRVIWTLIVVFTGVFPGLIIYFFLIFVIPNKK
jgi:phage shock protein C